MASAVDSPFFIDPQGECAAGQALAIQAVAGIDRLRSLGDLVHHETVHDPSRTVLQATKAGALYAIVVFSIGFNLEHLLDHRTGQVAGRGQLQSTDLGGSPKQEQRIGRDRRSGDFHIGEVGFEADRLVATRGLVTKSIETVEFEHRPDRFDAIQPSTNVGILEESWRNHDTAYLRSLKFRQLRHGRQLPRRWARAEMRLRQSAN